MEVQIKQNPIKKIVFQKCLPMRKYILDLNNYEIMFVDL